MSTRPITAKDSIRRSASAGFTVTEVLVAAQIVGILATIAIGGLTGALDKARVSRSTDGLRGIQAAMWMASDDGNAFPDAKTFWSKYYKGDKPSQYVLLAKDEINHGSNSFSHEGAGATGGGEGRRRVEFVVLALDEYGDQAEYIYIEDQGPPVVVTGPQNDPGYRSFSGDTQDGDDSSGSGSGSGSGSPAGGASGGGGAGGEQMVGWNGSESTETESTTHGWLADRRQGSRPDSFNENDADQSSGRSGGSTNSRIQD